MSATKVLAIFKEVVSEAELRRMEIVFVGRAREVGLTFGVTVEPFA